MEEAQPLTLENPFRPGAGHMPPYLAGRNHEQHEFERRLSQTVVTENLIVTGLRGIGKTVLLESFKPIALRNNWSWVGSELSESSSVSEEALAVRLLADFSIFTSSIVIETAANSLGFIQNAENKNSNRVTYELLRAIYDETPGLVSDKLKKVLETVWGWVRDHIAPTAAARGVVFAYDEAQNLADHAKTGQFPLAVMLDVFQSIQRKGLPFILVAAGLPTLFPKLVEARAYAERMFHVITLERLDKGATRDAILKPIEERKCPLNFTEASVDLIWRLSGGYPYFVQFICREAFDVWVRDSRAPVPVSAVRQKLDADFFYGRWAKATDRQRELLCVIAALPNSNTEFTVADLVAQSARSTFTSFSGSHANQMLSALCGMGLTFKDRHGKYLLAVPMLDDYIRRQHLYAQGFPPELPPPVTARVTGALPP